MISEKEWKYYYERVLNNAFSDTVKMGCFVGHIHIGPVGKMVDKDGNELVCIFDEETRVVSYKIKEE